MYNNIIINNNDIITINNIINSDDITMHSCMSIEMWTVTSLVALFLDITVAPWPTAIWAAKRIKSQHPLC